MLMKNNNNWNKKNLKTLEDNKKKNKKDLNKNFKKKNN